MKRINTYWKDLTRYRSSNNYNYHQYNLNKSNVNFLQVIKWDSLLNNQRIYLMSHTKGAGEKIKLIWFFQMTHAYGNAKVPVPYTNYNNTNTTENYYERRLIIALFINNVWWRLVMSLPHSTLLLSGQVDVGPSRQGKTITFVQTCPLFQIFG